MIIDKIISSINTIQRKEKECCERRYLSLKKWFQMKFICNESLSLYSFMSFVRWGKGSTESALESKVLS